MLACINNLFHRTMIGACANMVDDKTLLDKYQKQVKRNRDLENALSELKEQVTELKKQLKKDNARVKKDLEGKY